MIGPDTARYLEDSNSIGHRPQQPKSIRNGARAAIA
jgi:hypothetical protein